MNLNLSADEVLTTTRAVRKRLDLERPVEREVLLECLQVALQAPTGSNSQGWQWVFVEDPAKKKAIADFYGSNFDKYVGADAGHVRRRRPPVQPATPRHGVGRLPARALPRGARHAHPPARGPSGPRHRHPGRLLGIDPAGGVELTCWRCGPAGLGSAWTTLHLSYENEVAELLGIPADRYSQAGLFPIVYTKGTDFKEAGRLPVDSLVHFDTW